jgi:hypothetical protein
VHDVRDGNPEVLLILHIASTGTTARAQRVLRSAGALAFLDSTSLQFP